MDISGSKPRGRILTSLLDGRYKRSLITTNLERPTSIALDPELGYVSYEMFFFNLSMMFFL